MGKKTGALALTFGLSLLALCLVAAGAEAFLERRRDPTFKWTIAPIHQPDPELSYSGIPNASGIDAMEARGRVQYRVELRLNAYGFREVAGAGQARGSRCVVVLGDSVAFGIGVTSENTLASLLQARLHATRVFNFGYSGYGPNQTLRFLELGRERASLAGCREVKAYYFGVEDNFWRALGRANWGMSSPKYRLVGDELKYQGPYVPEWLNEWNNNLNKYDLESLLVRWWIGYGKEVSPWEQEIYTKIMRKIRDLLAERYGAEFRLIYFTRGQDPRRPNFRKLEAPDLDVRYFEGFAAAEGIPLAGVLPKLYLGDQTHMNEAGNRFLADELMKAELAPWLRRAGNAAR